MKTVLSGKTTHDYNLSREPITRNLLCHAPVTSLRFSHTGNVLVCCFNRSYLLGNIETDTISSIWYSDKLKHIRQQILTGNFSNGCNRCGKEIHQGNYFGTAARNYDYLAQNENPVFPVMLDFEIGNTCNYECIMCNGEYSSTIRTHREKAPLYPAIYQESFLEQLKLFIPHLKEARFVGGEPFLVDIHYPIWELMVKLNPSLKITILTNGSVLNARIIDLIQSGNFHISFSFDSLHAETYKQIRKRGDLEKVMGNFNTVLELLKDRAKETNVNVCLMRQNWHEMPDFVNFCNGKNVSLVYHIVYYPFHTSLWNWGSEKLREILNYYENIRFTPTTNRLHLQNIRRFEALIHQVKCWLGNSALQEQLRKKYAGMKGAELQNELIHKMSVYLIQADGLQQMDISRLNESAQRVFEKLPPEQLECILTEMLLIPEEVIAGEFIHISDERLYQKIKFAFG